MLWVIVGNKKKRVYLLFSGSDSNLFRLQRCFHSFWMNSAKFRQRNFPISASAKSRHQHVEGPVNSCLAVNLHTCYDATEKWVSSIFLSVTCWYRHHRAEVVNFNVVLSNKAQNYLFLTCLTTFEICVRRNRLTALEILVHSSKCMAYRDARIICIFFCHPSTLSLGHNQLFHQELHLAINFKMTRQVWPWILRTVEAWFHKFPRRWPTWIL